MQVVEQRTSVLFHDFTWNGRAVVALEALRGSAALHWRCARRDLARGLQRGLRYDRILIGDDAGDVRHLVHGVEVLAKRDHLLVAGEVDERRVVEAAESRRVAERHELHAHLGSRSGAQTLRAQGPQIARRPSPAPPQSPKKLNDACAISNSAGVAPARRLRTPLRRHAWQRHRITSQAGEVVKEQVMMPWRDAGRGRCPGTRARCCCGSRSARTRRRGRSFRCDSRGSGRRL